MRVRAVVPGAVTACAVALAGCGGGGRGDDVRTVTVTTPVGTAEPTTTTASRPDPGGTTTTRPTTTTTSRPPATTTTTATTTVTRAATTTTTTRSAPATAPKPASKPPPVGATDEDPVGGTTLASGRAQGTGYSVRVPDGWNDGARRFEGSSIAFDLTYVKGRGNGVSSNILVVRTSGAGVRGRSIDALRGTVRSQLEAVSGDAAVRAGPPRRIDGENAITFTVRRSVGGTAIAQRQVAAVRDGALFVIGLNAVQQTYAEDDRVFAAFLRSWRWS